MKIINLVLLILASASAFCQEKKVYFPVWTSHQKNANIYGVSAGVSDFVFPTENNSTYGLRISLIGEGILSFAIPASPVADNDSELADMQDDTVLQKINGINLSGSGSLCDCDINGFSAGFIGQIGKNINGASVTIIHNIAQVHNGVQLVMVANETYKMSGMQIGGMNMNKRTCGIQIGGYNKSNNTKGLQVGGYNISKNTRGIQLGLWNVNEKRKLPLINWNFRKMA